jgi:hypothetical protein
MTITILKYYLAINALLLLSWALLKCIRLAMQIPVSTLSQNQWLQFIRIKMSYLSLNRMAQALFIAAIIFPIVFSFLPRETLPDVEIKIRAPLSDMIAPPVPIKKTSDQLAPTPAKSKRIKNQTAFKFSGSENYLFVLLLAGFLVMISGFFRDVLSLNRLLADSILIKSIGRVKIYVSDSIKIPFSTLVGRGANIVVPTNMLTNAREMNLILRHEIHHHRNGDTLWIILMELARCIFYLNPIIYFWKKEITEVQEFACDEMLISRMRVSMREYGQCLVKITEAARGSAFMHVGTTCMGAGPASPQQLKSFLRRRIEVFQDHKNAQRKSFFAYVIGTVSVVVTATVAFGAQKSLRSEYKVKPNSGEAQFDSKIQMQTEDILKKYVKKFGAKGGFVLVSDPRSGRLLAAANTQTVNKTAGKAWSLSYQLEPASAMKGIIVAAAVDRKIVKTDDMLDCENGKYVYGGRVFKDWKPFKRITVSEAVMHSSNICGIKVGEKLGAKGLKETLHQFGFGPNGSTTDFPGALAGRYPDSGEISDSDFIPLISTGYTQVPGFYVTPLEVVHAYGAIANDGKLTRPQIFSDSGKDGEVIRQVISAETAEKMKTVLREVVTNGTGRNAQSLIYSTAGKTSTAYRPESLEHKTLGGEKGIAGFVGFAPVGDPKLVVYVGIIDPTSSKDGNPHGNEHAAPVFKEVIETILQEMKVAPDIRNL